MQCQKYNIIQFFASVLLFSVLKRKFEVGRWRRGVCAADAMFYTQRQMVVLFPVEMSKKNDCLTASYEATLRWGSEEQQR